MDGYQPAFAFPFAVNGLLAFTQVIMIVYNECFTDRFKLYYGFLLAFFINILIPFFSSVSSSSDFAFWTVFLVLLVFGMITGVI